MGQKVHPYGFRLGFNKPWRSRWFAKQGYATLPREDLELKEALRNRLKSAGISSIEGERSLHTLRADIDYGFTEANTTYGVIGIKCWLYKGEILSTSRRTLSTEPEPRRQERRDRGGDRDRDRDRRGPRGQHGGGGQH